MTDRPFLYDESLLSSCASSRLAAFVLSGTSAGDVFDGRDDACLRLLEQHASHYGRRSLDDENDVATIESFVSKGEYNNVSRRMRRFVSNVLLVHQHNRKQKEKSVRHTVSLNQFADREQHELPLSLYSRSDAEMMDAVWNNRDGGNHMQQQLFEGPSAVFWRLHDEESIRQVAADAAFLGSSSDKKKKKKHNNKKKKQKKKKHHHRKHDSHDGSPDSSPPLVDDSNYASLNIMQDNDFVGQLSGHNQKKAKRRKHRHEDAFLYNRDNERMTNNTNSFDIYLNWATEENPDGVVTVHPAMDQGTCGSCWAFAATGTVEASASRRAAYQAFTQVLQESLIAIANDTIYDTAVSIAQETERQTLEIANLSVQELIDCDTTSDQGCTGGNPLLAFFFIHRFGLTSWKIYPYIGEQDYCHTHRVAKPIATVQSWGILTPDHEANMEVALRYIGPIAVGVNGGDPTFLAYSGGIFDSEDCDQGANHAMLIVGFGQEIDEYDGSVVKYWIARNSWGTGWGEDGYIRVKRGIGTKGQPGVCGLAKNPSVALGGMLISELGEKSSNNDWEKQHTGRHSQRAIEKKQLYNYCATLGFIRSLHTECWANILEDRKALLLGLLSLITVAIFVVFPLTGDCRARRRRRRQRELARRFENDCLPTDESSALLQHDQPVTYGSDV